MGIYLPLSRLLNIMIAKKLFVIRKFHPAKDIPDALKKERDARPDSVYVDEEFRKNNLGERQSTIGFIHPP
jgi:hypothetical protein